jgi:hypothetical protein
MPKKPEPKSAPKPSKKPASPKKKSPLGILPTIKQAAPNARRPTPNPPLTDEVVEEFAQAFARMHDILEESAANIRALDRARLNGIGIKKQGFVERAYGFARELPQFLPTYLTNEKFGEDFQYFMHLNTLCDMCGNLREYLWNLTMQSADVSYTDALEFYASIREAAKRRIDGSETAHRELEVFFKKSKGEHAGEGCAGGETKKQLKRDFMAILSGKRDGKIAIENVKPHVTAGVRKVVDEKFTDRERFTETKAGEIQE